MQALSKILLPLFFILTFVNLAAEFTTSTWLIFATKPLLMVCLSLWFYLHNISFPSRFRNFILLGFIFSIFGDTFLMFNENGHESQHYFMLGLGSFLFTHVFYLLGFLSLDKEKVGLLRRKLFLILPFLLFLIGNIIFMWPDVPPPLRIAVAIYSTVIVSMAAGCMNLFDLVPSSMFWTLLAGVLLFVLSDSIIGLNKFKQHVFSLPSPRLLIMVPYLLSQYLIGIGSSKILRNEK